jgi:hypothetical protein
VTIAIEGHYDGGVAEKLLYKRGMYALTQQQGRAHVPKVVQTLLEKPGAF